MAAILSQSRGVDKSKAYGIKENLPAKIIQ